MLLPCGLIITYKISDAGSKRETSEGGIGGIQ